MAVMQMQRIELCAAKRDRKRILELLQRRGTVEIHTAVNGDEIFTHEETGTTRTLFEKNAETAAAAVEILNRAVPAKGSMLAFLEGREAVSVTVSDAFYDKMDTVLRHAQRVVQLEREVNEADAELLRIEARQEALKPWLALPVPQTFRGTKKTAAFVGAFDGAKTLEDILALLAAQDPALDAVHVEIVSATRDQTCAYVLVPRAQEKEAEAALRAIGFMRPANATHRLPKEKRERLVKKAEKTQAERDKAYEEIVRYKDRREDFRFLEDHMHMRVEKYEVLEKLAQTRHVFVLTGYVPAPEAPALVAELEAKFDCAVNTAAATLEEDAPVKLKNNWFVEPGETVLESYALPLRTELDPTPIMSIFYYVMFGLMFSDAGYGLIMAGICGICLLKFKNMEPNWSKNLRLFFWCGVSTLFWGIMFSSYFGDVVTVVSETFFGRAVAIPPLWFSPLDNPLLMLVFSLGLGLLHLSVGYILNGINLARNGKRIDVLYDTVFPLTFIVGLVVILIGTEMFESIAGFRVETPAIVGTVCGVVAGISALGIVAFGGRESKNIGKRLLKGAYALYNIGAGWLSDILSYSRLLALGLATGVIASVINVMGVMPGDGVVGFIIFVLIFIVGHLLNFGINVLGAYVHSNRLEFVEFFGKFYEGGGRKYEPFAVHTKHYKIIEEDTQNV